MKNFITAMFIFSSLSISIAQAWPGSAERDYAKVSCRTEMNKRISEMNTAFNVRNDWINTKGVFTLERDYSYTCTRAMQGLNRAKANCLIHLSQAETEDIYNEILSYENLRSRITPQAAVLACAQFLETVNNPQK